MSKLHRPTLEFIVKTIQSMLESANEEKTSDSNDNLPTIKRKKLDDLYDDIPF